MFLVNRHREFWQKTKFVPFKPVWMSVSHISADLPTYLLRQGSSHRTGLSETEALQFCHAALSDTWYAETCDLCFTHYEACSCLFNGYPRQEVLWSAIFCAVELRSINGCTLLFLSVHCLPHNIVLRLIPAGSTIIQNNNIYIYIYTHTHTYIDICMYVLPVACLLLDL